MMELPPRARRIQLTSGFVVLAFGTTSACAENTCCNAWIAFNPRNYLRVRGEYSRALGEHLESLELPPRARRIRLLGVASVVTSGTTSACAENTLGTYRRPYIGRNYLRVRGEYPKTLCLRAWLLELPPRARRIPGPAAVRAPRLGTTSACAENTFRWVWCPAVRRNYLRVRGEYSPRVGKSTTQSGTTSACAENTRLLSPSCGGKTNYLRVRGEYTHLLGKGSLWVELPPRARRILGRLRPGDHRRGTTSACAENTG